MPAPASPTAQSLILPNGLQVSLCHARRLKRCAAALRVSAGSHDVAPQWPGLAHFLEHLFFLGTERFPAEQNLMAFVQRHGGQINASTRERTTDFFFELAQPVFADGLERLCDMLAHPRMAFEDQLREREVLHAEFIAWMRDDAARNQMKLLEPVSAAHPSRWFHAGNRYSLPVPRPTFQQALQDFYRRFYQAGQMTLSLAGPQSLDELKALAERLGGTFPKGEKVEQTAPPPLRDEVQKDQTNIDSRRMHLMFACEDLPDGAEEAVAFFCFWLGNAQPGGLLSELKERSLIESLKAQVLYQFQGQVLIDIEIALEASLLTKASAQSPPPNQQTLITQLFFNWLNFFKAHYPALRNEYALLQQRQLDVGGALMLARHYSNSGAADATPGLSDQGAAALDALIDQLQPDDALLGRNSLPENTSIDDAQWCLPKSNPFLQATAHSTTVAHPIPALTFSNALPDSTGEGAVYLRWTLQNPAPALWQVLNDSLTPLTDDAQQAGVNLTFSTYGNYWQLKISGLADPMPAVVEHALSLLANPDSKTLARYQQAKNEPALIPIRQLLKVLPDHVLSTAPIEMPHAHEDLLTDWKNTRWTGFAIGFPDKGQNSLLSALGKVPGISDTQLPQPPAVCSGKSWHTQPSESSESAVLLFCPTLSHTLKDQACWRLLAHLLQTPFYQRLRVELQLGYAVFSGFRQIAGQSGMLFGVQSPNATAGELARHMEQVIAGLPSLIASSDIANQRQTLAAQFDLAALDTQQVAELLWQAHLAGHGTEYLDDMKRDLSNLHETDLLAAVDQLTSPGNGWLYLSNRSNPRDG
ncbi:MAG TPA: pyrroloquinoline quinone biosynthesis protein PqqF [Pseudomonas sp.]|uniref:pyrroloquinoline quinone biosynthesis protein PqqF n=1 Tax=Pseudomonas sp. TaxID=306 RepID=UPI002EDB4A6D